MVVQGSPKTLRTAKTAAAEVAVAVEVASAFQTLAWRLTLSPTLHC